MKITAIGSSILTPPTIVVLVKKTASIDEMVGYSSYTNPLYTITKGIKSFPYLEPREKLLLNTAIRTICKTLVPVSCMMLALHHIHQLKERILPTCVPYYKLQLKLLQTVATIETTPRQGGCPFYRPTGSYYTPVMQATIAHMHCTSTPI